MKRTVKEVADFVGAKLVGDGNVTLTGIASLQFASAGDLVFVEDEKHFQSALKSRASAVIVGSFATSGSKPLIISDQPRLAFARAARLLHESAKPPAGIHATAVVHPSAILGKDVAIEELASIHERAAIGDSTRIGAGAVIGAGVSIGRDCVIYPNVTIYPGSRLGD